MRLTSKLGIIGGRVSIRGNQRYAISSFAKVVTAFSNRFEQISLSSRVSETFNNEDDYPLPDNVNLYSQPNWLSTLDSLRYRESIIKSYRNVIRESDYIFIRGNPVAATKELYRLCYKYDRKICHWLVGDPMTVINSQPRSNVLIDSLGKLYIWGWEKRLLAGRMKTNSALLCNGEALAKKFHTEKTYITVSTSLTKDDFYDRDDTCETEEIRILTLCYIRPEKGIEYLIEAFAALSRNYGDGQSLKLLLAGPRDRYLEYQKKLDHLVEKYSLDNQVEWLGYIPHASIKALMETADIFVLPSLSEGTPRVLLEARATGLPIISTNVGGIPSSVTDGYDGLLVPPKNSIEIESALLKIIKDHGFRKNLIAHGYDSAKNLTVEHFVDQVSELFFNTI